MASSLIIQRRISTMIKRFKFEELECDVMPIFPEITWGRVKSKLIRNHKKFTTTNAVHIIQEVINKADIREKDLHDRLAMLEVIDVSRHNKRKIWYSYELTRLEKQMNYVGKRELEENIIQEFNSIGVRVNVKVVTHNDITFVYIKDKKKKKAISVTPFFFALFLGHKYIFCSKKNISDVFVTAIANALGYKKSKKIKLAGRDVRSLIKMLWIKQQGILHAASLDQSLTYEAADPTVTKTGIDYTQTKQREKYAKQYFGEDPPTLETLVVHGPQEYIQHRDLISALPSDTMHMSWDFRSHNIARCLTNLIENRVFVLPLPHYIANLIMIGKNELTLQSNNTSASEC